MQQENAINLTDSANFGSEWMALKQVVGGEIGIRTLGTVAGTPHFECGAFDHSAISPRD
jgi:hypothetical protein